MGDRQFSAKMLLYTDALTGDEMISDAYDLKEIDDVVYEADSKMIVIKDGEVDIGANASAEEAAQELAEDETQVNNIVHSFRLTQTSFDKKAVKEHLSKTNPDRVPVFEKNAQGMAKKILGNFKDYEFYTGEGMNPDGMVALLNYREDGVMPYFTFWKDGLKEVKL